MLKKLDIIRATSTIASASRGTLSTITANEVVMIHWTSLYSAPSPPPNMALHQLPLWIWDLTVQGPLPTASHMWWPSLETCSNPFTPASPLDQC